MRDFADRYFKPFLYINFTVFLSIYTEASIFFAFILFFFRASEIVVYFFKAKVNLTLLGFTLLLFGLNPDKILIAGLFYLTFFLGKIRIFVRKYVAFIIIGIFFSLFVSFFQRFGYLQNEQWVSNNVTSRYERSKDYVTVFPIDDFNSGASYSFGYLGSGRVAFNLEIQGDSEFALNLSVLSSGIKNGRKDVLCNIKTVNSLCEIVVYLDSRQLTWLIIGGFGTWKTKNSYLKINRIGQSSLLPPFSERYDKDLRAVGFSFNSNAFGAQMAVIGLLVAAFVPSNLLLLLSSVPTLICIFFSGSRGSLAGFCLGLLFLLVSRTRYYKILLCLIATLFFGASLLQGATIDGVSSSPTIIQLHPNLRSLYVGDKESTRTRLEIWRLATKAWLENPRTFLIGTGDLTTAMKVKFDARSSRFGLTKDSLTHAHNLWIQTAGQSGLLGLCAMLWLWGWVLLRAWRSRDAGALALLAAIFVINSVDYLFFYAPVHLAFWMAAAGLKPSKIIDFSIITQPEEMKKL